MITQLVGSLIPPGLSGPVLVDRHGLPRYWAAVWSAAVTVSRVKGHRPLVGLSVTDPYADCSRPNAEAKYDIAAYIVDFYNSRRLHSVLGNQAPSVYERTMAAKEPIAVSEIT